MSAILKNTPIVKNIHKKIQKMHIDRPQGRTPMSSPDVTSSADTSLIEESQPDQDEEYSPSEDGLDTVEPSPQPGGDRHPDITRNPLHEIVVTAGAIGIVFGFGGACLFFVRLKTGPAYLMALAMFHFLEYWVTAKYNPQRVHSESFIINNGSGNTLAHILALAEYLVEYALFPKFKMGHQLIKFAGLVLVIGGQYVRTIAMKTAGQSFNHLVQTRKQKDHELITGGIYFYLRHPSYFGFFWWAVGTQLMLLNPLGVVAFALILYSFFSERIAHEERILVGFFGERYVEYKRKTPVYIPFMN